MRHRHTCGQIWVLKLSNMELGTASALEAGLLLQGLYTFVKAVHLIFAYSQPLFQQPHGLCQHIQLPHNMLQRSRQSRGQICQVHWRWNKNLMRAIIIIKGC